MYCLGCRRNLVLRRPLVLGGVLEAGLLTPVGALAPRPGSWVTSGVSALLVLDAVLTETLFCQLSCEILNFQNGTHFLKIDS